MEREVLLLSFHASPLNPNVDNQTRTNYRTKTCEKHVDRNGIVVEDSVIHLIDQGLKQIDNAAESDDAPVSENR